MMNNGLRIVLVLFFCFGTALTAQGIREEGEPVTGQETLIRVSGIVRLVGNDPFSEIVISGTDTEWYVERGERQKLISLQHQTVTVEGLETVLTLTYASGRPAGERHTLRDIKIISVSDGYDGGGKEP